jgi:hypothetical protein
MALRVPHCAEREYLAAYGIVAVYVAALPAGHALVSTTRDLLKSLIAHRRKWRALQITCAYWVKDRSDARLIANEVNAMIEHDGEGLLTADARTAQRCIENVAAHMSIILTDHDTVLLRARAAVAYIEGKIAEAQAHGELSWFNRAYREWRLQAQQQGRSMSYAEARARLRLKMFQQILVGPDQEVSAALFPPLRGLDAPIPE